MFLEISLYFILQILNMNLLFLNLSLQLLNLTIFIPNKRLVLLYLILTNYLLLFLSISRYLHRQNLIINLQIFNLNPPLSQKYLFQNQGQILKLILPIFISISIRILKCKLRRLKNINYALLTKLKKLLEALNASLFCFQVL